MKKIYRLGTTATALCLLLSFYGSAQDSTPPPPPPAKSESEVMPPAAPVTGDAREMIAPEAPMPPLSELNDDQGSGVIIRQKGKKDAKIIVELHGGDVTVNGKPISQFKDKNVSVTRLEPGSLTITSDDQDFSPFRDQAMNQAELNSMQLNLQKQQHDVQLNVDRAMRDRERVMRDQNRKMNLMFSNGVHLGVGTKNSNTDGALVIDLTSPSPAEKAGIKKGDVITKVNGKAVHNPDELYQAIHGLNAGDKAKVTFKRDGKEQTVTAVLEKSKDGQVYNYNYHFKTPEVHGYRGWDGDDSEDQPKLGMKAQDNEEGRGVDVLELVAGSAAEKAGLKKGDNIVRFNGEEVNSAEELADKVGDARGKGKVSLSIIRDGKPQDIDLHIPRKLKSAEL